MSRLEAGRGLATPLLVVMRITSALKQAMSALDPNILSEDARRIYLLDIRTAPDVNGSFFGYPLTNDPGLEALVQLYHELPERHRQKFLTVARATASALRDS